MTSPLHRLAACLPVLTALACDPKPEPEPEPEPAASLEDRVFLSTSVTEGGDPRALEYDTRLRLQFFEHPRVNASAGCNSLSGEYAITDDVFTLADAGQTEIGCDLGLHDQDDWYFDFLLASPTIVVDGDTLVLDGDGVHVEYLDQEVAAPDAELTGVTWTVQAIIDGDLATVTEWPSPATLVFGADGVVEVNTGCNGGSGTYSVEGTELTFTEVAVTERGCDGETGRLEAVVLGLIHGPQPVVWEITVDRLSLRGQGFGLDLVAGDG